ncbi:hypothetical protein [Sporichthya sp.]|uniref:hypothetical protein n=1 Tax=Sporichthya sp. TaxID=65475 RepID=UPI0017A4A009|nr:hypothetical protein [Sporichthya sp.]MBA3742498.1 hypothetical protein [Sporichthya sp.]
MNIARRHLSKGQQAMIAAKARFVSNQSQRDMARDLGLAQGRIAYASTVLDHAADLAAQVVAGALARKG